VTLREVVFKSKYRYVWGCALRYSAKARCAGPNCQALGQATAVVAPVGETFGNCLIEGAGSLPELICIAKTTIVMHL
jgi:hypothetical protein